LRLLSALRRSVDDLAASRDKAINARGRNRYCKLKERAWGSPHAVAGIIYDDLRPVPRTCAGTQKPPFRNTIIRIISAGSE
jgi:hypothetical protein